MIIRVLDLHYLTTGAKKEVIIELSMPTKIDENHWWSRLSVSPPIGQIRDFTEEDPMMTLDVALREVKQILEFWLPDEVELRWPDGTAYKEFWPPEQYSRSTN